MNMELQEIEAWLDRLEKRDVNQGEATAKILDLLRGQVLANRSSIPVPNHVNDEIDGNAKQRGRRVRSIGVQDVADLRAAYERRGDMGWRTATASPVALVLEKDWRWLELPGPFEYVDDAGATCTVEEFSDWREEEGESTAGLEFELDDDPGDGRQVVTVSVRDLEAFAELGVHYMLETRVCGVYLCDQEAADELRCRGYNYSSRACVYRMPARGSLADLVDLGPGLLEAADRVLAKNKTEENKTK